LFARRESECASLLSDIHLAPANIVDYTIFLLCDFKAWSTHEVTIAPTFVHPFCMCLPTPSDK